MEKELLDWRLKMYSGGYAGKTLHINLEVIRQL
jgi:hypothetical protein